MLRHITLGVMGIFLLITFLCVGLRLMFTSPVMEAVGINPIAVEYINGQLTKEQLKNNIVNNFKFRPLEIDHFTDVKQRFGLINMFLVMSGTLVILLYWRTPEFLSKSSKYGMIISALLVIATAIILATGYWKPLTAFLHNLVFPDGNWRFGKTSLTIQLYPRILMQTGFITCFSFAFLCLFTLNYRLKQS